jgi:hypothetical protein
MRVSTVARWNARVSGVEYCQIHSALPEIAAAAYDGSVLESLFNQCPCDPATPFQVPPLVLFSPLSRTEAFAGGGTSGATVKAALATVLSIMPCLNACARIVAVLVSASGPV